MEQNGGGGAGRSRAKEVRPVKAIKNVQWTVKQLAPDAPEAIPDTGS